MSIGMMKMWISIAGMGFMFLSIAAIYLSRFKLKGVVKFITTMIAYILMIFSGILIVVVLFS